jgi:hypothetical protein
MQDCDAQHMHMYLMCLQRYLIVMSCAGFFADKDADAKARGEDVKKKSKEEEFSDFMTSIAADVQEV